jgi:leader peptidase (prepilin peptidase)/N-methyltransferase
MAGKSGARATGRPRECRLQLAETAVEGASLILLAPIVGSFLGVVVRRLPEGRDFLWSRSRCESCAVVLGPRDLMPLVSWAASRGRCRHCAAPLGWFYPGIEIAALAIAALALLVDGMPGAWLDCLFGWWLLTLGWIDLRRWLLPDALTLPLIVAGLVAAALFDREGVLDRALGAAFGYLALSALAAGYRALRGHDGLGGGDAKLLAAAGAWVGASALPQVILAAALAGLVAAGVVRLSGLRLRASSALPFGPFIALASWAIWLFGPVPWIG